MDGRVMKVVIAGGSGFIGRDMVREFNEAGYEVVVLSRSTKPLQNARVAQWDGKTLGDWAKELEGAKAVINLTGETVAQQWTEEVKKRLVESRLDSTRVIGEAIAKCEHPPEAWVNASAIGYYGDTGDQRVDEDSQPKTDMMADLSVKWEAAMHAFDTPKTRKSCVRVGFVLGRDGGAFKPLWTLTKLGLGSPIGNGKNWIPWIHMEDLSRIFRWCVESGFEGQVNGVGPSPVTFNEFMSALRKVARRPWVPNVPVFMAKLGELFGSPPVDLLLTSARVESKVLPREGFEYKFGDLEAAVRELAKG
jgi:uncharacterized protein (TIGR01777 family)